MEKCVSLDAYIRKRSDDESFACRAAAIAARLAIDPPLTKSPPASGLNPRICRIQSIVRRSSSTGAGAERQMVRLAFNVEASRSANAPIGVPGDCTYPNIRGCAF